MSRRKIAVSLTRDQWQVVLMALGCIEAAGTEHEIPLSMLTEEERDRFWDAFHATYEAIGVKLGSSSRKEKNDEDNPGSAAD